MIVARRGDYVVGFAQVDLGARHPRVPAPSAELGRLYVQSHFLRRGIGAELLRRSEALVREDRAATLWLTAYVGNLRALAFYASQGHADRGRSDHVFEDERFENRVLFKLLGSRVTSP